MKKFLTVLLALSVVFTYSFSAVGSVFAATDQSKTLIDNAYNNAVAELETSYKSLSATLETSTEIYEGYAVRLDKRALQEVADKVRADYNEVLRLQYDAIKADSTVNVTTATEAAELFTNSTYKITVDATTNNYLGAYLNNAYYGQVMGYDKFTKKVYAKDDDKAYLGLLLNAALPYTKEYVTGEIAKVAVEAYSDKIVDSDDAFKTTYAQLAKQYADKLTKEVNDISFAEDETAGEKVFKLGYAIAMLGTITAIDDEGNLTTMKGNNLGKLFSATLLPYDGYKTIDNEFVVTKYIIDDVDALKTADALKADEAQDTANRAAYKAYVEKKYAEEYASYLKQNLSKDVLAKKVEALDKYKAVALAIIEEGTADQASVWGTEGQFDAQLAAAPGRYDVYADAEKRAEILKLATDKTGELLYDAAVIDDNMAELKMKVYYDAILSVTTEEIVKGARISADTFAWDKEVALAQNEKARATALGADDKYYAPEKDAINALFDKRAEEINACTTSAQIKQVTKPENAVKVPSTVKEAKTIVDGFEKELVSSGLLSNELNLAKQYIAIKNNGKLSNDATRIKISEENLKTLMAETFAENGARTNNAAKAMMDKVYAAIDAYPTQGAQNANVKAAQDAIDALPSTITAADKDAVRAAYDMLNALTPEESALVKDTRLDSAIDALRKIAEKEINAAIKALPAKLTAADKAAVEAAQALIDAYDDEVLWDETWTGNLDNEFKAVREAELKDVTAAIYKLGENPTKEAVEAARAAYDAYVEYWTDAANNDNAADDVINDKTLFYAEAQVKAKEIKAVESLKITVSTKLYKGSKIRVKWTVKGDASVADGYKVYKSTKAQKGYKFMGKTKKSYMDNKKNLKKGTRYFYKVRAYKVVDGVTYYSDYSNKGNRIYKK